MRQFIAPFCALRLCCLFALVSPIFACSDLGVRRQRLEVIVTAEVRSPTFRDEVLEEYRKNFQTPSREALKLMREHDLEVRFDAAFTAAFYASDRALGDMGIFFEELSARAKITPDLSQKMLQMLIKYRDLDAARAIAEQFPGSTGFQVPDEHLIAVGNKGPRAWRVIGENAVDRVNLDLGGATIVVVSHPACHFSQRLIKAIGSDSELGAVFRETRTIWLAPADGNPDLSTIFHFNRAMSASQEQVIAYREDEWPQIPDWSTPNLYFMKDGAVVARVSGWPASGRKAEVLAAAQGLTQSGHPPQ